jgi:hypothetical protein
MNVGWLGGWVVVPGSLGGVVRGGGPLGGWEWLGGSVCRGGIVITVGWSVGGCRGRGRVAEGGPSVRGWSPIPLPGSIIAMLNVCDDGVVVRRGGHTWRISLSCNIIRAVISADLRLSKLRVVGWSDGGGGALRVIGAIRGHDSEGGVVRWGGQTHPLTHPNRRPSTSSSVRPVTRPVTIPKQVCAHPRVPEHQPATPLRAPLGLDGDRAHTMTPPNRVRQ